MECGVEHNARPEPPLVGWVCAPKTEELLVWGTKGRVGGQSGVMGGEISEGGMRNDDVSPVGWDAFVDLMEQVLADDALLPQVVAAVRAMVQEVASLPVADMAGHTRALLTAATRALAGRRGPTEAELAFVEELGATRATQGIGIEVVLGAVHVAERAVWTRAREAAAVAGVPVEVLLDARELYDDWAGEVRARLITSHRQADAAASAPTRDREAALLRRMLEGGSAAALAVAERGLPPAGLWVLVARADGDAAPASIARLVGSGPGVRGRVANAEVAVVGRAPSAEALNARRGGEVVAVAGPVPADEIGSAHRQATATVAAAEELRRGGVVHVSEVAVVAALLARPDLGQSLVAAHRGAALGLGTSRQMIAETVRVWAERDRDAAATAAELFVHPNTVRNRVQRFAEVTGIDPWGALGGVEAWWLARAWTEL